MTTFPETKTKKGKSIGFFVTWLALLVLLCQVIRVATLQWGPSNFWFSQTMGLDVFRNYNFAFSVPLPTPVMYLIYGAVLAILGWYLSRNYSGLSTIKRWAWVFIVAGAVSNIGERSAIGYVVDYLYFFTGIFNLADLYILGGVVILLLRDR